MRRIVIATFALVCAGCGPGRQAQKSIDNEGFNQQIVKYEATFRPSDYDPDPARGFSQINLPSGETTDTTRVATPLSQTDVVQGFRVQVFSSTDIAEAKSKKYEVEELFPAEWFYLEYDSPTYKVRAGNFQTRFAAEKFTVELAGKGYPNAWTVPAKVFRNPPPPPPPQTQ